MGVEGAGDFDSGMGEMADDEASSEISRGEDRMGESFEDEVEEEEIDWDDEEERISRVESGRVSLKTLRFSSKVNKSRESKNTGGIKGGVELLTRLRRALKLSIGDMMSVKVTSSSFNFSGTCIHISCSRERAG